MCNYCVKDFQVASTTVAECFVYRDGRVQFCHFQSICQLSVQHGQHHHLGHLLLFPSGK